MCHVSGFCVSMSVSTGILQLRTPSSTSAGAGWKFSLGWHTQECPSHVLRTPLGTEKPIASPDLSTPLHHDRPETTHSTNKNQPAKSVAGNWTPTSNHMDHISLWGLINIYFKPQFHQSPSGSEMRKIWLPKSFIFSPLPLPLYSVLSVSVFLRHN